MPIFTKEEFQSWARIAFGTALPLIYYEELHSSSKTQTNNVDFIEEFIEAPEKGSYTKLSFMAFCIVRRTTYAKPNS